MVSYAMADYILPQTTHDVDGMVRGFTSSTGAEQKASGKA